jgi:hypothetical protein
MKNVYIGELKSLEDENEITILFIEEGFSLMTNTLLEPN